MRAGLRCTVPFLAALTLVSGAAAADGRFLVPSLTVSEEYNDNVDETLLDRRTDYITRVQPGLALKYAAPRWTWDGAYAFDYRYYARGTSKDEYLHNGTLNGRITVIDNLLFVEVGENYKLTSIDITRDAAEESLNRGQEKTNSAVASAYVERLWGNKLRTKSGYRYVDTRYYGSQGIDKSEHIGFADLAWELAPKFSLTAAYLYSQNNTATRDIFRHQASGGFRYEYADKSFLFGSAGNSWQRFDHGATDRNPYWHAGLTHSWQETTATLETRTQFTEDPLSVSTRQVSYSGRLDRQLRRGRLGFVAGYDEYFLEQSNTRDRQKASLGGTAQYEFIDQLTGSLSVSGDRTSRKNVADYPYRLVATATLAYTLRGDLTISGTYTHVTYRYDLQDATDKKDINRAILALKKTF